MTDEDWDRVLDINLRGTFIGAREAAKQMIAADKGGVIINLASTSGFRAGGPGMAHYVASKHGVRGLTKSLAVEFGPYGIRVLALAPTLIDTPGIGVMREEAKKAAGGAPFGDLLEQLAIRGAAWPDGRPRRRRSGRPLLCQRPLDADDWQHAAGRRRGRGALIVPRIPRGLGRPRAPGPRFIRVR